MNWFRNQGEVLFEAASQGNESVVARLLQKGAPLEWTDSYGETPLSIAANYGHEGVVRQLIAAGANVHHKNNGGNTPLSIAAHYGREGAVQQLIAAGANIHHTNNHQWTPLHYAAFFGYVESARQLLAAGADINAVDKSIGTPLHWASEIGYDAMVRLFLEAGADLSLKDDKGKTARDIAKEKNKTNTLNAFDEALVRAAASGDMTRVRGLLDIGVDANTTNDSGETPLLVAVTQGDAAIVELLLKAGADAFQTTTDGSFLVVAAQRNGHDEVVAVFEKTFKTALSSAVSRGDATEVASVLAQGNPANCVFEGGRSLLHVATALGIVEIIESLISAEANINAKGETALHVAVRCGHKSIVQLLVDAGADCDVVNEDKLTPMALAEKFGLDDIQSFLRVHTQPTNSEIVSAVVSHDANLVREFLGRRDNPNATDETGQSLSFVGQSLIQVAATHDHANTIKQMMHTCPPDEELVAAAVSSDHNHLRNLLSRGGNPNATDEVGQTLLHLAVLSDAQDILAELLKTAGIDISKSNQLGDSPLVMAIKHGHRSFAKRMFAKVHNSTRHLDASELTVDVASRLGHGGFGAVYKGSWSGRTVAVKAGLRMDEMHGLRKEIRAMQAYVHVAVPAAAAWSHLSPHVQLVLEYMDGGDLRNYLYRKSKGEVMAVEYSTLEVAWVIANALADLHHEDLLHRDLKSHNVLLSSTNYIKLADLGLARNDASTMTKGVGTLYWMAPEVQDPDAKYNAAADIYSFGVILTELNTFQIPYADIKMAPVKVVYEVMAGRLRPSLRADCPTWLRELATACMAHDPKQRPTAHEIVKLLQRQLKVPMDAPTTPPSANPAAENTALSGLQTSNSTWSSSGTQSFSALSTASLVAPTINCSSCKTPQSLLNSECSKCAAPAKPAKLKLKVLNARLTKAKDRGVNISVPCFVCSAPTDATTDDCGECQYISTASDDERLCILVAILGRAGSTAGTSTWTQLPTLVSTAVVCPVCKVSHSVTDAECPTCASPALPASAKLDGLLHRIKTSGAAVDTSCHCTVCESATSITDAVCSDCEEPLWSDAVKVYYLCRRIELFAATKAA
ncbi:hypothetical protein ACHHYP_01269 [Achlya hypogyna]|uniref:Protein kinase domain-containing protein n=1 Tax=Achlya hypogyna TaxID=1202772 RepID=A0A1V9Z911_ACHHY|nr:hypothetical protein ACHHYP_01269 [Achlya hypogyna]